MFTGNKKSTETQTSKPSTSNPPRPEANPLEVRRPRNDIIIDPLGQVGRGDLDPLGRFGGGMLFPAPGGFNPLGNIRMPG